MSDDQNKTVTLGESHEDVNFMSSGVDELFVDGTIEELDLPPPTPQKPDNQKTVSEILAEEGVTLSEINEVFPPGYEPLSTKPSEMSKEELKRRVLESVRRQENARANTQDKTAMPDQSEVNRKYIENAPETIRMTSEGQEFSFEAFLGLLENSKTASQRARESEETQRAKQSILNQVKQTLGELIENSELENFTAETARKIFLDKIKTHSRLPDLLRYIRACALKGQAGVKVDYLGQYDKIQLAELGFTVTNKSGGGKLSYAISWDDRVQQ